MSGEMLASARSQAEFWRTAAATFLTALITGIAVFYTTASNKVDQAQANDTANRLQAEIDGINTTFGSRLNTIISLNNNISVRLARVEGQLRLIVPNATTTTPGGR